MYSGRNVITAFIGCGINIAFYINREPRAPPKENDPRSRGVVFGMEGLPFSYCTGTVPGAVFEVKCEVPRGAIFTFHSRKIRVLI
jgi:hypothetical protein